MNDDAASDFLLILGLGILGYAAWTYLAPGDDDDGGDGGDGGDETSLGSDDGADETSTGVITGSTVLTPSQISSLASSVLEQMRIGDVTPQMVTAIATIESGGDPGALRQEPAINDASYGLMQVLLGTATWLATGMGYTAYGTPTAATLLTADGGMYFGCAYLHWLRNYQGTVQSDAWVVAAYNGGPGGVNGAGPQRYLAAYQTALSNLGYA
jgi:hypothetical protein